MRPSPGAGRSGDSVSAFMARVYRFAARRRQVAIVSRLLRHSAVRHPWGSACRRCSTLSSMPELHEVLATRVAEGPAIGRVTLSHPVTASHGLGSPSEIRYCAPPAPYPPDQRTTTAVPRRVSRQRLTNCEHQAALRSGPWITLPGCALTQRARTPASAHPRTPRIRASARPRGCAAGPRNVSSGIDRAPDTMSGP